MRFSQFESRPESRFGTAIFTLFQSFLRGGLILALRDAFAAELEILNGTFAN
jgi:hypothetical protein